MSEFNQKISFFLGANTPNGFVSLFDQLYDPKGKSRCYVIKGGPGTGKSGLMKKIAKEGERNGYEVEYINCSSDPHSLDAIIFPELNICMADGTSPHVIEPKFPGACEILVNLGECWDSDLLFDNAEPIIALTEENSAMHKKCVHFLASAALLANDSSKLFSQIIDIDKIRRYASRLAAREFPNGNKPGRESKRFLSAVTPEGIFIHDDTIPLLCDKTYIFEDESDITASIILAVLRDLALDCGLDIITCRCPLSPYEKIEHMMIPELRLGFFTANTYHPIVFEGAKTVHAKRFWDETSLMEFRNRLSFNRKTQKELIGEAIRYLSLAKATHDKLEQYYISAMDFDLVNEETARLIDEIFL